MYKHFTDYKMTASVFKNLSWEIKVPYAAYQCTKSYALDLKK